MTNRKDPLVAEYREHVRQQYNQLVDRKLRPTYEGISSPLLYGSDFPFGTYRVIPEISKYSLFLDIEMLLLAAAGHFKHPDYSSEKHSAVHVALKATTCRWKLAISAVAQGIDEYDKVQIFEKLHQGLRKPKRPHATITDELNEKIHSYLSTPIGSEDSAGMVQEIAVLLGELCSVNGVWLADLYKWEIQKHRNSSTIKRFPRYLSRRKRELDHDARADSHHKLKLYFRDRMGVYNSILQGLVERYINIIASRTWTLLPMEVAMAQLSVSNRVDVDIHHALRSICTSPELGDVFFKYEVETLDESHPLLIYMSDHFLSTTYKPDSDVTEGIAYAKEYMARLLGEVAQSNIHVGAVMNVDVAESSAFVKKHGYVDTYAFMIHFRHLCEREFLRHRAVQHDWAGDGGVAIFDTSYRCFEAAMTLLPTLKLAREFPPDFRVRIGIASGELGRVLDREGCIGKETGEVLNRAGHLQKYVRVDAIAIDDATRSALVAAKMSLPTLVEETNEKGIRQWVCTHATAAKWVRELSQGIERTEET